MVDKHRILCKLNGSRSNAQGDQRRWGPKDNMDKDIRKRSLLQERGKGPSKILRGLALFATWRPVKEPGEARATKKGGIEKRFYS